MTAACHNWNDLSRIIDVATIDSREEACLQELQTVIEKHGMEMKLGVALLHKHFDINEDQMLVETNSRRRGELVTRPVSTKDVDPNQLVTTIWRFDGGMRYGCTFCNKDHCESGDAE
jgi:hypothetical protein